GRGGGGRGGGGGGGGGGVGWGGGGGGGGGGGAANGSRVRLRRQRLHRRQRQQPRTQSLTERNDHDGRGRRHLGRARRALFDSREPDRCAFHRRHGQPSRPEARRRLTAAERYATAGRLNQKRVSSGDDSAPTRPPPSSTSVFTIARPIPAPPPARSRDFSTR